MSNHDWETMVGILVGILTAKLLIFIIVQAGGLISKLCVFWEQQLLLEQSLFKCLK